MPVLGVGVIEKIKAIATAVISAVGLAVQFQEQIEASARLVIAVLTVIWLLVQIYYKIRNERRKGRL